MIPPSQHYVRRNDIAAPEDDKPAFDAVLYVALQAADVVQQTLLDGMFGRPTPEKSVTTEAAQHKSMRLSKGPGGKEREQGESGMPVDAFRRMVNNDVDFFHDKRGIKPQEVREDIDRFREEFRNDVLKAKSFEETIAALHAIVVREHHRLMYQTNSYMSAAIKEDYFNEFVDMLTVKMAEQGMLDSTQCERLDELEAMYDMGMRSYNIINECIGRASSGEFDSVLQQAESEREVAKKRAKGKAVKSLEEFAQDVVRNTLLFYYGINGKQGAPEPSLAVLARLSDTLTRAQLRHEHPNLDFRDPDLSLSDDYQNRFMTVLQTWRERFAKKPTINEAYGIYLDLQKQIRQVEHLPEDFSDLIEQSAAAAKKETGTKLSAIQSDHMAMLQTPVARMRKVISGFDPTFEQLPALERGFNYFIHAMEDMPAETNKFDLIEQLEAKIDHAGSLVTLYGIHPAMLLAVREYMSAFRKHLCAALHEKGDTDMAFLGALKEMETKVDLIHENSRILGHWMMQNTEGGHDSVFWQSFFTLGARSMPMGAEDIQRIHDYAADMIASACEQRGISPSLGNLSLIPLVYARCEQIAQQEMNHLIKNQVVAAHFKGKKFEQIRAKHAPHETWAGHVTTQDFDDRQVQTLEEAQAQSKMIHERALSLLHQAIMRIVPPSAQPEEGVKDESPVTEAEVKALNQPKEAEKPEASSKVDSDAKGARKDAPEQDTQMQDIECPVELTAHNLRLVMEYLDSVERGRSTMQMH